MQIRANLAAISLRRITVRRIVDRMMYHPDIPGMRRYTLK